MQNYKVLSEVGRWSLRIQSRKRNQNSNWGSVRIISDEKSILMITANTARAVCIRNCPDALIHL